MIDMIMMLDFHLFDGDGGGDGGDGASSDGLGAEARAFMDELDGGSSSNEGAESEPMIVYGKDDAEGDDGTGQVGADQEANGYAEDETDPEAEFAELIGKGGRFEKIYGQYVANAVNNRFKNAEDLNGKVAAYEEALAPLYAKYGLAGGDIESVARAIAEDDDIYTAAAEQEGMTLDRFKEHLRLKADAEKGRTMLDEFRRQQERKAQFEKWDTEAAALQEVFPNFDMAEELKNESFTDALDRGYDVRDAFFRAHMDEILSGSMKMVQQQTKQDIVDSMRRKAARPAENGTRQSPAIVRKSDPSKLTNEDMDRIFDEVENGKSFSF